MNRCKIKKKIRCSTDSKFIWRPWVSENIVFCCSLPTFCVTEGRRRDKRAPRCDAGFDFKMLFSWWRRRGFTREHLWSLIRWRQDDDAVKHDFLQLLCSFNREESHRKTPVDINIGENSSPGLKICKILGFSSCFLTFWVTEGTKEPQDVTLGLILIWFHRHQGKHLRSLSQRRRHDDILNNAAVEPALLFHVHTSTGFLSLYSGSLTGGEVVCTWRVDVNIGEKLATENEQQ